MLSKSHQFPSHIHCPPICLPSHASCLTPKATEMAACSTQLKSHFNGINVLPIPLQHSQYIHNSIVPSFGVPHLAVPSPAGVVVAAMHGGFYLHLLLWVSHQAAASRGSF